MNSLRLIALVLLGAAHAAGQSPLTVSELPEDAPLAISASATPRELVVRISMAPDWHLYARDVGGGQPVALATSKDSDLVGAGALVLPESADGKLRGSFELRLPLKKSGAGRVLTASLDFMACDPLECRPPMTVTIAGEIGDVPKIEVLLVVDQADDRSKRIVALFAEHGLRTTVTTYATVTLEACDAHDVVLADSKLFRQDLPGTRQLAVKLPKTGTPIVAVGFLGTELVEAHGIAMTSGYI